MQEALGGLEEGEFADTEYGDEYYDNDNTDEDEEYEYNGGDTALYDSLTDNIDELKTMKETIEDIYERDKDRYMMLMSGVPKEELEEFRLVLGGADVLIADETET